MDTRLINGKCECYPCVWCFGKGKADHIVYRKMVWTPNTPRNSYQWKDGFDPDGIAMCHNAAKDAMQTGRYVSCVPELK